MLKILALLFFTLNATINIYSQGNHARRQRFFQISPNITLRDLSKIFVVPSLILIYSAYAEVIHPLLLAGLCFGWLGDIFLIHEKPINVIFGIMAFSIGHICYTVLFFSLASPMDAASLLPIGLFGIYPLLGVLFFNSMEHKFPSEEAFESIVRKSHKAVLKCFVPLYMLAIVMTNFSSLTLLLSSFSIGTVLIFTGSLLFISSDFVLGASLLEKAKSQRHDMGKIVPRNVQTMEQKLSPHQQLLETYIMFSYISAQFLIVIGFIQFMNH